MSEVYKETIGSLEKPDKPLFRIPTSPVPNWKHESKESTALRRAKNLEFIFSTFEDPILEPSGRVLCKVVEYRFDCWPASDTYYIHSSQIFGCGIAFASKSNEG